MDRQATFLLALGLLIAAAALVSASGWVLFVRDRRAERTGGSAAGNEDPASPQSSNAHHEGREER